VKIKDRNKWLPGGWQVLIPQSGMKKPFTGSFTEAVQFLLAFRSKNPALCEKNGWKTEIEDVEFAVDQYNSQRMVAGGFLGFVEMEGDPPQPTGGKRRSGPGVVAAAVSGLAIYRELFTTSTPVSKDEAERRAAICTGCPQNKPGGFKEWFVGSVAKGLTELLAIMRDLDLTTSRDNELGTCAACHCPMRAKVFADLTVIRKHMRPEETAALDKRCWILPDNVGS
jgi:hypothetical protein